MVTKWRQALRERCPSDDAGTSLIELVVGMALMSVFLVIFTGAVLLARASSSARRSMAAVAAM